MRRYLLILLVFLPGPLLAKHGPMPLADRVAASDLIVVGRVASIEEVERDTAPGRSLTETARRVAIVRVERLLAGRPDGERLRVGFATAYACDGTPLVAGGRYLLFLARTDLDYHARVNWQFGALAIEDGRLDEPDEPMSGRKITLDEAIERVAAHVPPTCPGCAEKRSVVPILYGEPGPETAGRDDVHLAGCKVRPERWHCRDCGQEW